LGAAGALPAVRSDVHHLAELVASVWPLLATLPATSLRGNLRRQRLGPGRSTLQRSHAVAGSDHGAALGLAPADQSLAEPEGLDGDARWAELFAGAHHPCLGLGGSRAYSAAGGKLTMSWQAVSALKQQIPLLDYLQGQDWKPVRRIAGGKVMGGCARCMRIINPVSCWTQTKTCSIAMDAGAGAT
jgi:hypothetical protein